jgi:hypothetical protein
VYDLFVSDKIKFEAIPMTKSTNSVNGGAMPKVGRNSPVTRDRRHFIGGSDARIIMGHDEKALNRLWREKRGEAVSSRG